MLIFNHVKER